MGFLFALGGAFLFALACNLDTVLIAAGYAVKGIHIRFRGCVLIAAVTTAITYLSLVLGDLTAQIIAPGSANVLGGIALVGLGMWFFLSWMRSGGVQEDESEPSKLKSLWGCVSLAGALAVNNAGIGVAAGVSGLHPLLCALCNFVITLAAIPLGTWLARRVFGRFLGRYALPLSAGILILLGIFGVL
ncbi:MAG: sporulation protein [Oscillospiraceae bacterium]|nr:sporulation protein [Oscillospiraceae bacterium]